MQLLLPLLGLDLVDGELLLPDSLLLFGLENPLLVEVIELLFLKVIDLFALLLDRLAMGEREKSCLLLQLLQGHLLRLALFLADQSVVDSQDLQLLPQIVAVLDEGILDDLLLEVSEVISLLNYLVDLRREFSVFLIGHLVPDVRQEILPIQLLEDHFLAQPVPHASLDESPEVWVLLATLLGDLLRDIGLVVGVPLVLEVEQ